MAAGRALATSGYLPVVSSELREKILISPDESLWICMCVCVCRERRGEAWTGRPIILHREGGLVLRLTCARSPSYLYSMVKCSPCMRLSTSWKESCALASMGFTGTPACIRRAGWE